MSRHIVIPIDESTHSETAFRWALENVVRPGDTVDVLHVADQTVKSGALFSAHMGGTKASELAALERTVLAQSSAVLERYAAILRERGIGYSVATKQGDPRTLICDYIDQMRADMCVMGSRGHGAVKRMLIGSVSHYVVQHANVPVVVYRAK